MKHCVGLDNLHIKIKKRHYEAFRNRYITSPDDKTWKKLVEDGFAEKRPFDDKFVIFRLTDKGYKVLEKLLNLKITELF